MTGRDRGASFFLRVPLHECFVSEIRVDAEGAMNESILPCLHKPFLSNILSHPAFVMIRSTCLLLLAVLCQSAIAKSPNVVVVLTDDQGWGDVSFNGNPNFETPNIDRLAREGAKLDHFYVCAVCSPTRAEFLTGRYHTRMGVFSTSRGGERFNANEITIADVFRQAGYATAAYGKWHSGMQAPYHPNTRGFDDYYGFCSGHWGNYFSPMLEHNGELVQGDGFLIDDLTSHAIRFIESHRDQPFFIYLPFNTPHSPMQAPREDWEAFKEIPITPDPDSKNAKGENKDFTRAALAMCKNIDDNVGRLLACLEQQKVGDDTIVVYFSDNGPNSYRFNGGLRGRKGAVHEGGLRSPCVMRYPKKIPSGTVLSSIGAAIDLLPTLADFAGIELADVREQIAQKNQRLEDFALDGSSLAEGLSSGGKASPPDRQLLSAWNGKFSIRNQRFRYHAGGQLYSITEDPGEDRDVADQHPEVVAKLRGTLESWVAETKPRTSKSVDSRPFLVGHPAMKQTQLPARDAEASGGIKRSNRFPNCSYFRNWTDVSETIHWNVDVAQAGTFDVMMKYACPESSVGTKLRLSGKTGQLDAVVERARDVPEIGPEEDLIPRGESYVKDWATMSLGTIQLDAGPQKLTLEATEIPGEQAIEMRLLMFERR